MDSQGDCLRILSHLKRFDRRVGSHITIIDPTDPWPPALNLFSWNRDLAASLTELQREEMLAGVIETFKFTCEGLFGTGLTPRMQLVFQYLALWILQIPGASLHTLIDLLRDPTPYLQHTLELSPTAQGFIEDLFADRSQYRETRQHILSRLHAVVANPLFERMFAHPENKFDIGAAMNTPGHVTLINTAKAQLKAECSALFGRFWIARIYQATMARAFLPAAQRRLSVVLIDEAHEYLHGAESTLEQLLFQARKYRVSINLIHQTLDQFRKAGVLGATLGVPALRFTGAISDSDANLLAKEMNTTPEFLKSVRKTTRSAEWAVFARNITQTATKTTLPFLEAEREPKMSPDAYRHLRQRNRQRVGAPRQPHQPQARSHQYTHRQRWRQLLRKLRMASKRRPKFKRAKPQPIRLTNDDIAVIRYVGKHRFRRTTDILRHLPDRSAKHLRARLRPLYDHAYLDLPKAQQDDHTTREKIYALGNQGAALLAELDGVVPIKSNWSDKNRTVRRPHIHHTLRIGDIEDAFARTPRHVPDALVMSPADILALAPPRSANDPKPWLWQSRVRTADGGLRTVKAIPDAVLGLDLTDQRKRYYFFCEADRGTMPVVRTKQKTSSVVRKFEAYLAGFHAGLHRTRYGINNLRFLIITTTQERIETMLKALSSIAETKDSRMFLFADFNQVTAASHILAVPWRNGRGECAALLD